jgi:hypothetical protein
MVKRLTAKIGEYEKDGQTKGRYVEVGVILSSDKGEYILMDPTVNLAGVLTLQNMLNHKAGRKLSDRVMVSVFSEDRQGGGQGGGGDAAAGDDIPF